MLLTQVGLTSSSGVIHAPNVAPSSCRPGCSVPHPKSLSFGPTCYDYITYSLFSCSVLNELNVIKSISRMCEAAQVEKKSHLDTFIFLKAPFTLDLQK